MAAGFAAHGAAFEPSPERRRLHEYAAAAGHYAITAEAAAPRSRR